MPAGGSKSRRLISAGELLRMGATWPTLPPLTQIFCVLGLLLLVQLAPLLCVALRVVGEPGLLRCEAVSASLAWWGWWRSASSASRACRCDRSLRLPWPGSKCSAPRRRRAGPAAATPSPPLGVTPGEAVSASLAWESRWAFSASRACRCDAVSASLAWEWRSASSASRA